jgi:hypothetical protein
MSDIFQVPAAIADDIKITPHKTIKIKFETREGMVGDAIGRFSEMIGKWGWLTFSIPQIEAEDLLNLPEIKTDAKKTPSQRLRNVLYRNWEKDNGGHEDFESYYLAMMEKLINHYKDKLG